MRHKPTSKDEVKIVGKRKIWGFMKLKIAPTHTGFK